MTACSADDGSSNLARIDRFLRTGGGGGGGGETRSETNGQFLWTAKQQGLVLSGFAFGYITTQVLKLKLWI